MRKKFTAALVLVLTASVAQAQQGPAQSLLGDPTAADYEAWSRLSAADRLGAYEALPPGDRQVVDQRVQSWVVARCDAALAKGDGASFLDLGAGLNLVPAIALEADPKAKVRLVGAAYAQVIEDNGIKDWDQGRTFKARASTGYETENPAAVIGKGGGTCGELSYALSQTLQSALGPQPDKERPLPANDQHDVDVRVVFGYGTVLTDTPLEMGAGSVFNHAGVRVEIDGEVLACDPAYFLTLNQGNSLRGFADSSWFLRDMRDWKEFFAKNKVWVAYITEWEDEEGHQNDGILQRLTPRRAAGGPRVALAPVAAVVRSAGDVVTFTGPVGEGYRWSLRDGDLGRLEGASGAPGYDLSTATNEVRFVATTPRRGEVDVLEVEVKTAGRPAVLAKATILGELELGVTPAAQTTRRGGCLSFGLSGLPAGLDPRELTARWRVSGQLGFLDLSELWGSELATFVCISAPASGAQVETITCDLFLGDVQVGTASGTITVEGGERPRDPFAQTPTPPTTPTRTALPREGKWKLEVTASGVWDPEWVIVNDEGPLTTYLSRGTPDEDRAATEKLEVTFDVGPYRQLDDGASVHWIAAGDLEGSLHFSATSSTYSRGSIQLHTASTRTLSGIPGVSRPREWHKELDLDFLLSNVRMSSDGRRIEGTFFRNRSVSKPGRFRLAPDAQLTLVEREETAWISNPYYTFLAQEVSFTLTKLAD